MPDTDFQTLPPHRRIYGQFAEVLILLGMVGIGFFTAQVVSVLGIMAFAGGDADRTKIYLGNFTLMGEGGRYLLLGIQGVTTVLVFILPPLLLMWAIRKQNLWGFSPWPVRDNFQLLWTAFLIPALAPLLELTIQWNKNLDLPDWLSRTESWMVEKESTLERLTEYMIAFTGFDQFLLGLFVIAVLAAVGEELLFRGTIQPMLEKATGSPHRAIWLTAILFSAIHLQFYGFLPRMLLGALFGYLYHWSRNISIPILAHFTNNGITVTLSYLARQGRPGLDPDRLPEAPIYVLVLSALAGTAVLYRFRQNYFQPYQSSLPHQP